MLDLEYLPVQFTFYLILGIIMGFYFNIPINWLFVLIILNFLSLIFTYFIKMKSFQFPIQFFILSGLIFVLLGILVITVQKPVNQNNHYINYEGANDQSVIQITKILKPSQFYSKYEANVLQINDKTCHGTVLILVENDTFDNRYYTDDILITTERFIGIRKSANPYEFDYRSFLKKQHIYDQLILRKGSFLRVESTRKTLKGKAETLREKIQMKFEKLHFNKREWAIVKAILLGQKTDISKQQFEQYKNAGAIHILAVSGLHIGIILLFLNFLFKPFEYFVKGKIIKLILVICCLWFYAFLAGLSPSIIRSVTMFTAVAFGMAINRVNGVQYSLVISIFILLLAYPLYLFNVGFQLSYLAVFGILLLQPYLAGFWQPKIRIIKYLWTIITVSFAAQLGVLPLSLYYFHQFPGLFMISSLVIIPFLGTILGMGFIIIILAFMNLLPKFLAEFYEMMIRLLNEFVAFISELDIFIIKNITLNLISLTLFYLLIVSSISFLKRKNFYSFCLFLLSVLCIQLSLIYDKYKLYKRKEFIVFHLSKKTVLANRYGKMMKIYLNEELKSGEFNTPFHLYESHYKGLRSQKLTLIQNVFKIDSEKILIIDSLGVYKGVNLKPEILILINSPKINVYRMLNELKPNVVIADGSNYNRFVNLWERTCQSQGIEFHHTQKHGAYMYKY